MDIEVEFSFQVVRSEFAETIPIVSGVGVLNQDMSSLCFIPGNNIRGSYLPHPCEEGQEGEYQWSDDEFILVEGFEYRRFSLL